MECPSNNFFFGLGAAVASIFWITISSLIFTCYCVLKRKKPKQIDVYLDELQLNQLISKSQETLHTNVADGPTNSTLSIPAFVKTSAGQKIECQEIILKDLVGLQTNPFLMIEEEQVCTEIEMCPTPSNHSSTTLLHEDLLYVPKSRSKQPDPAVTKQKEQVCSEIETCSIPSKIFMHAQNIHSCTKYFNAEDLYLPNRRSTQPEHAVTKQKEEQVCTEIETCPHSSTTLVYEKLLYAPKRRFKQPEQAVKKQKVGTKQVTEQEVEQQIQQDEERKQTCDYCKYRHHIEPKPSKRMFAVARFKPDFQDFVVNYSTVTQFPEKQGLLEIDDHVCNACEHILQKKFDAFKRNAVPYTPGKKGRKSQSQTTAESGGEASEELQVSADVPHLPPASPQPSTSIAKEHASADYGEITEPKKLGMPISPTISNKKCAVCKEECNPFALAVKFRHFRPCVGPTAEALAGLGYTFDRDQEGMIHESCRNSVQLKKMHNIREPVEKSDVKMAKDEAISKAIEFAQDEVIKAKKPVLFSHIYQKCYSHLLSSVDADFEWEDEKVMPLLRYHITKFVEDEHICSHKINGSTMYYHKDLDFVTWSHSQLQEKDIDSPQSASSVQFGRVFRPSDVVAVHNCLQLLRNELENASMVCQIYGQYPELISSLDPKELLWDGKRVRVQPPEEEATHAEDLEVVVPPFPPLILNFLLMLCAPKGSKLELKAKDASVDFSKHSYDGDIKITFYSSILNILSTILHHYKVTNIYPWPIMMSQVMHHPSRSKKVEILKQLGMLPSSSSYARYKCWVAAKNQKNSEEGHPFGLVDGHHISIHVDNKEFFTKHSVTNSFQQYLAVSGVQPKPSNKGLTLPPSAYSHAPNLETQTVTDFDLTEYMAMFPNAFSITGGRDEEETNENSGEVAAGTQETTAEHISPDVLKDISWEEIANESSSETVIDPGDIEEKVCGVEGEISTPPMEVMDIPTIDPPEHQCRVELDTAQSHQEVTKVIQRFQRPRERVKVQHTDIKEYSVPSTPAPSLRHEYVYQRSDFLVESILDRKTLESYQSIAYLHAGLRQVGTVQPEIYEEWSQLFPNLKEFLKIQYKEIEGSIFIWLAVVPGIPNSPKILLYTMQLITNIFIQKKFMKNIIITADAVEYNALYKIRKDYGALFGHIYLYWGFWHALGNYLKQFFKAYRNGGIEAMFKKLFSASQIETIFKVTPNWSFSNKMTLNLAEALIRSQWVSFINHAKNTLEENELNVFNQEEQKKCLESLQLWKEKSCAYSEKVKATTSSKARKLEPEVSTTSQEIGADGKQLRSGTILKPLDPSAITLKFSSGSEESDESDPTSPVLSQQEDPGSEIITLTSPSLPSSASSPYALPLPSSPTAEQQSTDVESLECDTAAEELPAYPDDSHIDEEDAVDQNDPSLCLQQKELQEFFTSEIMPLIQQFIERGKKQDRCFHLFSNMLDDIWPYIIGFLAMRFDDFDAQHMVTKLMYEKVHVTQQSMYKHILLQVLEEFPRWDDFPKQCLRMAPGANEIDGSVGATLGRDEAHERVISLNLAYQHPVHPTLENVETMCQSAPILCHNLLNIEKKFFVKTVKKSAVTSGERSKEEKFIQSCLQSLHEFKAFNILDRNQLSQPGTSDVIPEAVASSFLDKSETSRSIAEAIVEQQILKRNVYNRTALKKTLVHPLPNMASKERSKKKMKVDKEKNILASLVYNQIKQQEGHSTETLVGIGIAEKPPLFFNSDGTPSTNSNKSSFRMAVLKRYGENNFQYVGDPGMDEKTVLIDGMPTLFLAPVLGLTTFGTYAKFLLSRKVFHFFDEANEVHIVFDVPYICGFNLKKNVQSKRDSNKGKVQPLDGPISDDTKVPSASKWSSFLANRENKRKLVIFLGQKLLLASNWLPQGKKLIAGGCFTDNETYIVTQGLVKVLPDLNSNHEEADTRMFAHAAWSKNTTVQIVASDTDIFAILLLNHEHFSQKTVIMQYDVSRGKLDMSKLIQSMNEDTDTNLARLRKHGVSSSCIFGIIHCLIGSDILCSPRGFGPSWIMKTCLDYAPYLFHQDNGIQHLGQVDHQSKGAYLRFILALFKKRYSSKIKETPDELLRPVEDYSSMISKVQTQTWAHTLESKSMLPSQDCLLLRELNLAFQLQIWTNATCPIIQVGDPKKFGWEEADGEYQLKPDSEENLKKQKTIYDTIMRKCGCKSSQCLTGRCTCKKNGNHCTSLCECLNCENNNQSTNTAANQIELSEEDGEEIHTSESESEETQSDNEMNEDIDI